ncbi:fibronectin type III domain-containing protein [Nocardioides yefusunii]|uniref:Fibronectin type III domain-containing protein n=1 Tax=Nocardioides yefusunii TaxID=2500546 RepID=A0ABW1QVE7_9ACTN|nr:fibronectin type III domain-containing protein [Nocardioides yefusunii]
MPETTSAPSAPLGVATSINGTSVTLTWQPPANPGTSPLTGYVVTSSKGTVTLGTDATSYVVRGLTRGDAHTLSVAAVNAVGTGAAATVITPAAVPAGAVQDLRVDHSGKTPVLRWSAPADDGGADLIRYFFNDGRTTYATSGGSYTLTSYARGATHTFSVYATTKAGNGARATIEAALPRLAPTAPRNLSVQGRKVSWQAPEVDVYQPAISGYTLTYGATTVTLAPGTTTHTLPQGLQGRTTVSVAAVATTGTGVATSTTVDLGFSAVAAASGVKASFARTDATVAWAAPASLKGHENIVWTVVAKQGKKVVGTKKATVGLQAGSVTFTGLARSATTFSITGQGNRGGAVSAAVSVSATPANNVPSAPRNLSVSLKDGVATVKWKAPADNGGKKLTKYVLSLNGKQVATPKASATSAKVKNVRKGVTEKFVLKAVNGVGTGLAATEEFYLVTAPGKLDKGYAKAGLVKKSVFLQFAKPKDDGGSEILFYELQYKRVWGGAFKKYYEIEDRRISKHDRSLTIYNASKGTYTVRVRAMNRHGASPWSAWSKGYKIS